MTALRRVVPGVRTRLALVVGVATLGAIALIGTAGLGAMRTNLVSQQLDADAVDTYDQIIIGDLTDLLPFDLSAEQLEAFTDLGAELGFDTAIPEELLADLTPEERDAVLLILGDLGQVGGQFLDPDVLRVANEAELAEFLVVLSDPVTRETIDPFVEDGRVHLVLLAGGIARVDVDAGRAELLANSIYEYGGGEPLLGVGTIYELGIVRVGGDVFGELFAEATAADPTAEPLPADELPVDVGLLPDDDLVYGVRSVGGVDLWAFTDTDGVDGAVRQARRAIWLAAPFLVVAAAGAAWMLAGRALAPVSAITRQVRDIRPATLDERVPVPASDDEVAELATTMNAMLDRLEQGQTQRRQFVADASHELRSPLAILRNEAEVARAHPESTTLDELSEVVLGEGARLEGIVADLLELARTDEVVGRSSGAVVDLDEVVLAEAGRARRLPVDRSGVSAGRVNGRLDGIQRAVAHLLDNAVRHAHTRVAVGVRVEGDEVVLTVDDDGPGVAPGDRQRIFERFVRLDEARSRDAGGAGLGLAVVRAAVAEGGGTVWVTESPLGGARFELRWPAA